MDSTRLNRFDSIFSGEVAFKEESLFFLGEKRLHKESVIISMNDQKKSCFRSSVRKTLFVTFSQKANKKVNFFVTVLFLYLNI